MFQLTVFHQFRQVNIRQAEKKAFYTSDPVVEPEFDVID